MLEYVSMSVAASIITTPHLLLVPNSVSQIKEELVFKWDVCFALKN